MNFNEMSETLTVMSEYNYLIHLIRAAIRQETPEELPDGLSFETVYRYAMEHDVANLAFYAVERLQKKPEAELYAKWSRRRDLALVRDMHQEFAYDEIVSELKTQGIPYKELQGTVLKKLYPRTEYRTMSDIDFIVEKKNLPQCGAILEKLGYRCKKQDDFEIDGFRSPDIYVELHTDYFSPHTEYYNMMKVALSDGEMTEKERYAELYLYNVLHIAKHYFSCGCGIRRILDMYFIDQCYRSKIDTEYVSYVLTEVGLNGFADNISRLADAWFGDTDMSDGTVSLEREILNAGLHGRRENYISRRLQCLNERASITFGTKVKYLLSRIFPCFKTMKIKYPVLNRVKLLLPFCWFHRIIRMLLGKNRKESVSDLRLVLQSENKNF